MLGIVPPALPDDPYSRSPNPSVNGRSHFSMIQDASDVVPYRQRSCSRSPEAVGGRSPDSASASLRGLTCLDTSPGYDYWYTNVRLAMDDLPFRGQCG